MSKETKDRIFNIRFKRKEFNILAYILTAVDDIVSSTDFIKQITLGNIEYGKDEFTYEYKNDITMIHKAVFHFRPPSERYAYKEGLKMNYVEYKDYFITLESLYVDVELLSYEMNASSFDILDDVNYSNNYKFKVYVTTDIKKDYNMEISLYHGRINLEDGTLIIQVDISPYFTNKGLRALSYSTLKKYIELDIIKNTNIVCRAPCKNEDYEAFGYIYENNTNSVLINFNIARYREEKEGYEGLCNLVKVLKSRKKGKNTFEINIGIMKLDREGRVLTKDMCQLIVDLYKCFDKVTFHDEYNVR